jgi:hypothetical protein
MKQNTYGKTHENDVSKNAKNWLVFLVLKTLFKAQFILTFFSQEKLP